MPTARLHETLLGTTPSKSQLRLYDNPAVHGWLDGSEDPEKFLAVFMRALALTLPPDGETFRRSFLLLPPKHEAWAVVRMKALTRHMLVQHAKRPMIYNLICKLVSETAMATRVLQMEEPARWVAFGFGPDCDTPSWLRSHLLV